MPSESDPKSNAVGGQPAGASVYEFLYHDERRVGSLLAQLNPQGHIQSKRTTSGLTGSKTVGATATAGVGVAPVASASQNTNRVISDAHTSSLDMSYDPLWSNAVALLDYLEERRFIQRDMFAAAIGQIALISGSLSVTDLGILNAVWNSNEIKGKMVGDKRSPEYKNNLIGYDVVKTLPHLIQATIVKQDPFSASWMFLDKGSLVQPAETLLLNHGTLMPGDWNVLGIKDANPDGGRTGLTDAIIEAANENLAAAAEEYHTSPLILLARILAPHARNLMGRPGAYFGITPVLIFREITAPLI